MFTDSNSIKNYLFITPILNIYLKHLLSEDIRKVKDGFAVARETQWHNLQEVVK